MLEDARLHEQAIQQKLLRVQYEERYKYYWNYSYRSPWKPHDHGTWNRHEFASVDRSGNVLGVLAYDIDRDDGVASNLSIISFTEDTHPIFAKDLARFLRDIFEKFHFRKLRWSVLIGNPVERHYDRLCERYGGRIVGIQYKENRIMDGTYADKKLYEIHHDDYMERRGR